MRETCKEEVAVTTTMSRSYQVTVPSVIRKALGLQPGDQVSVRMERDHAVLRREESHEEKVRRLFADLEKMKREREKRMTPEEREFAEMSAGWTVNQYHEYFDNLPEAKAYMKEKYGI